MFKNRQFNRAILISTFCHLICMQVFYIVVTPDNVNIRNVATVSFLGPILEKSAVKVSSEGKSISALPSYKRPFGLSKDLNPEANPASLRKDMVNTPKRERPLALLGKIVSETKQVPAILPVSQNQESPAPVSSFAREGEGRELFVFQTPFFDREVLYKPPLPKYPKWTEDKAWDFDLELRVRVSPEGRVEFVERVLSSGSPTIDLLGIRYVRNWQFVPITEEKDQWGTIKLNFRLK